MFINVVGMETAAQALAELSAVARLMVMSGEFRSFMLSPGFTQAEKESALRMIAERSGISGTVVKFIIHLTDNRVVGALSGIVKAATAIYLEKKKQAKAIVFTPVEVTKGNEERLKASLKKLVDRDIEIEYVIDPLLLGGILVKVGSTMYDSSIKGQLRLLKDELIKG
jgi:ATP synthase F1 delta subunit